MKKKQTNENENEKIHMISNIKIDFENQIEVIFDDPFKSE